MSEFIESSKVVLSTRVPLRSGLFIPVPRRRKILRDAFLEVIQHPKVILRVRVILCCGFLEPLPRLRVISRYTPPVVIEQPEVGLRFRYILGCLCLQVCCRGVAWRRSLCLPRGENECGQENYDD